MLLGGGLFMRIDFVEGALYVLMAALLGYAAFGAGVVGLMRL